MIFPVASTGRGSPVTVMEKNSPYGVGEEEGVGVPDISADTEMQLTHHTVQQIIVVNRISIFPCFIKESFLPFSVPLLHVRRGNSRHIMLIIRGFYLTWAVGFGIIDTVEGE